MSDAFQLIERVFMDKLVGAPSPFSGLQNLKKFLCVLSLSFLIFALILLIYGAHIWLSVRYSEDMAAILTGTISLALSMSIASIFLAVLYYQKTHFRKLHEEISDKIKSSLSTLENELGDPIRENPKTAVILASFLGFIAENQLFELQKRT